MSHGTANMPLTLMQRVIAWLGGLGAAAQSAVEVLPVRTGS
jgi:hypothetical protein